MAVLHIHSDPRVNMRGWECHPRQGYASVDGFHQKPQQPMTDDADLVRHRVWVRADILRHADVGSIRWNFKAHRQSHRGRRRPRWPAADCIRSHPLEIHDHKFWVQTDVPRHADEGPLRRVEAGVASV